MKRALRIGFGTGTGTGTGIVRLAMAMLALVLALPGCVADFKRQSSPGLPHHERMQECAARWWQCLGDPQLPGLIDRTLGQAPWSMPARDSLSGAIARRYVALRLWQTTLVLLAAREEIDGRLLAVARHCVAGGAPRCQPVAAAEAQLLDTRADQGRTRMEIAAQRDGLAVLTESARAGLDRLPGGPIPLPPISDPRAMLPGIRLAQCQERALAQYGVARVAAAQAQSAANDARAAAALLAMRARAGTLPPGEALAADRHALEVLQGEERARAAMALAYVALAQSPGCD